MHTKTVIVTGANTGLGYECAKSLAEKGKEWHVVIACRDIQKGNEAAAKIRSAYAHATLSTMALDLASLASVRQFAKDFAGAGFPPLHGLVCNAGVQVLSDLQYTKEGYELMFGVNHLGHFLLVDLLLPQLVAPARIVLVSSGTHHRDSMEGRFNKPVYKTAELLAHPTGKEMNGFVRYATSKLCNMLFANELDRRLKGNGPKGINVYGFDPGAVPDTSLIRSLKSNVLKKIWEKSSFLSAFGIVYSTPEKSGAAMARLILDPALENVSGKYFQVLKERPASNESFDAAKAKDLWESSERMVGMRS